MNLTSLYDEQYTAHMFKKNLKNLSKRVIFSKYLIMCFCIPLKAGCYSRCAFREWRLVGDKLQLFCFKDYDALIATRPAVNKLLLTIRTLIP